MTAATSASGTALAVVASGAAERHVQVDVPDGALEGGAGRCAGRAGPATAPPFHVHVVGTQK